MGRLGHIDGRKVVGLQTMSMTAEVVSGEEQHGGSKAAATTSTTAVKKRRFVS